MKKITSLIFLIFIFGIFTSVSSGKELPKIAMWDLTSGDIKTAYAQDLTLILVSEIAKLGSYEVYSQENVRTLAGWTEERMKLGCSSSQCLIALGQMDIAKLISGRVGRIGSTYSISLNLFDTQNARSERAVSEFCRTEDELIPLVQGAVRKLLGVESASAKMETNKPEKATTGTISTEVEKSAKDPLKDRVDFSKIPWNNALIMGNREAPLKMAVFTDPDCVYCGKFHGEMEKVIQERKDIAFYIFMFPLTIHKDAYWKSKSIVCQKSLKMLADAFAQKEIPKPECNTNEIDDNIRLAEALGVKGTPSMVFPDGRMRAGAMTAKQLVELIEEKR